MQRDCNAKNSFRTTSAVDQVSGYASFWVVQGASFRRYWVETLDYHDRMKYDLQNELIEGEKAKRGI
jgi:hypothetical protein